jgi:hypothetical protein
VLPKSPREIEAAVWDYMETRPNQEIKTISARYHPEGSVGHPSLKESDAGPLNEYLVTKFSGIVFPAPKQL